MFTRFFFWCCNIDWYFFDQLVRHCSTDTPYLVVLRREYQLYNLIVVIYQNIFQHHQKVCVFWWKLIFYDKYLINRWPLFPSTPLIFAKTNFFHGTHMCMFKHLGYYFRRCSKIIFDIKIPLLFVRALGFAFFWKVHICILLQSTVINCSFKILLKKQVKKLLIVFP